jgi:Ca2+-transporting ATPase
MLGQLLHALSCRARGSSSVWHQSGEGGSLLKRAVGGSIALQVGANIVPFLRTLLGLGSGPRLMDMAVILAGAGLPFLVNEGAKRNRPSSKVSSAIKSTCSDLNA